MMTESGRKSFPKVLVLLATYNGHKWLVEQIESILNQELVIVQIQISDDASNDGTEELVRTMYGHDHRISYRRFDVPSGSAGANFRRLYRIADLDGYDFVALADQDDIWDKRKISSAVTAMSRVHAKGYSCSVRSFWPDGRTRVLNQEPAQRRADFLFEGAGQGCSFVIRQELFRDVQKFCIEHERSVALLHYHDWLIYLLSRAWGAKWYFDQTPHMQYRQHGGNEIGSRGSVSAIRKRVNLINSGWYKEQVSAAILIYRLANKADKQVNYLDHQLQQPDSIRRRISVAYFVLKNGRRKTTERLFMSASAAAGKI